MLASMEARIFEYGELRPTAVSQAHHGVNPAGYTDAYAQDLGDTASIFAMLSYNNCQTNFSTTQNGLLLYRFSIASGDAQTAEAFSSRWQNPPLSCCFQTQSNESAAPLPPNGSLLSLTPDCVRLLHLKAAEDGRGIIVRLWNSSEEDVTATLILRTGNLQTAYRINAIEEDERKLALSSNSMLELSIPAKGFAFLRLIM